VWHPAEHPHLEDLMFRPSSALSRSSPLVDVEEAVGLPGGTVATLDRVIAIWPPPRLASFSVRTAASTPNPHG
jgi:hypothetical protein